MVLKVIDPNDASNVVPAVVDSKKLYVKHAYGGSDTLNFEIAINNNAYKYILEETKIEYKNNRYLVKLIDEQEDFATVRCDIDLDDFKKTVLSPYRRTNVTLQDVLRDDICVPLGWTCTIDSTLLNKHTTIEESEGKAYVAVTPYTLLSKASEIFECVYEFNSVSKEVKAKDVRNVSPSGQFFSDELNLRSVGYVGSSEELVTRLYAYGKKNDQGVPMTFASINDGKPYVDDNTYSNRIVVAIWSDERYTVAQNLLDDARAKLAEMAKPERSYTCDVNDVGEGVWLYKVVTLIDRKHQIRVNHMIVEYNEYEDKDLDSITLSTMERKVVGGFEAIKESISEIVKNEVDIGNVIDAEIQRATELLMGEKGGRFEWLYDGDGFPIELINYCSSNGSYPESETEQANWQNKWIWNENGLGFTDNGGSSFNLALTKDGKINASMITTGSLNAGIISAGVLESVDHSTFFDLDNDFIQIGGNDSYSMYCKMESYNSSSSYGGSEGIIAHYYIPEIQQGQSANPILVGGISSGSLKISAQSMGLQEIFFCHSEISGGIAYGGSIQFAEASWDQDSTTGERYLAFSNFFATFDKRRVEFNVSDSIRFRDGTYDKTLAQLVTDTSNASDAAFDANTVANQAYWYADGCSDRIDTLWNGVVWQGYDANVNLLTVEAIKLDDFNAAVLQNYGGTCAFGVAAYPLTLWGSYVDFKTSDIRVNGTPIKDWIKS